MVKFECKHGILPKYFIFIYTLFNQDSLTESKIVLFKSVGAVITMNQKLTKSKNIQQNMSQEQN